MGIGKLRIYYTSMFELISNKNVTNYDIIFIDNFFFSPGMKVESFYRQSLGHDELQSSTQNPLLGQAYVSKYLKYITYLLWLCRYCSLTLNRILNESIILILFSTQKLLDQHSDCNFIESEQMFRWARQSRNKSTQLLYIILI